MPSAPQHPSLVVNQLFLETGVTEQDILEFLPYCSSVHFNGDIALLPLSLRLLRKLESVTLTSVSKPLDKSPRFKILEGLGLIIRSIDEAKVLNSIIKNAQSVSRFHIPSGLSEVVFKGFTGEWVIGETRFLSNPTPRRIYCYQANPDLRYVTQFLEDGSNKKKRLRLSNNMDERLIMKLVFNLRRQVQVRYKMTDFTIHGLLNIKFQTPFPLSMIKNVVNLLLLQTSGVCWSKNKRRVLRSPELQGLLREMLF